MKPLVSVSVAAILFVFSISAIDAQEMNGHGQAVVTVIPSHSTEQVIPVGRQDIQEIKVNGKPSEVTGITSLQDRPIELVLLIDQDARASLGTQLSDINTFARELPPNTRMAIAWMQNGEAKLSGPLSSDPAQILKGLHIPAGFGEVNASPYFSLSDLAKKWPSQDRSARREVVMITDGIDDYHPHYDPDDPYVQAAINDSVRSGLVVYALYWSDQGRLGRFGWAQNAGQNLLTQVTEATGGVDFWQGFGTPVSFDPYFKDLRQRLSHQYLFSFTAPFSGKPDVATLDLKLTVPEAKVDAPEQVFVVPAGNAAR